MGEKPRERVTVDASGERISQIRRTVSLYLPALGHMRQLPDSRQLFLHLWYKKQSAPISYHVRFI